jgi:outer membrane protein TolC
LADFEIGVQNLVKDVEIAYWELYYAYRALDAAVAGCDSAQKTWQKIYSLYINGAKGGEKATEAQAREQYFLFRSTAEQAQNALYSTERKLRYMLGLAATDGRMIRPLDEPTAAKVAFDWSQTHCEAITRSAVLRRHKWLVKEQEMALIAAKNWLLPRLDLVARYRWLGMGTNLVRENGGSVGPNDQVPLGAYENLFGGQFQDWHLGFEFKMPIGYRKEHAGVRNAELAVARQRALLQEAELEISHELAYEVSDMKAQLALMETNYNRRIAAERNVDAVNAAYDNGTVTIDVLLQAQRLKAAAESDYYRSLTNYNEAIMKVHYIKGSLLEYNGVYLAEGPWPGKAYFDARRRARARDAASYLDYGFTMPRVLSRGPYQQFSQEPAVPGEGLSPESQPSPSGAGPGSPEVVPAPQPEAKPSEPELKPVEPPRPLERASDGWSPTGPGAAGPATAGPPTAGTGLTGMLDLYEPLANSTPLATDRPAPGGPGL